MGSRFEDFLKTCDINEESIKYVKEKQRLIEKKINSEEFQSELRRYSALASKNRLLIYKLIKEGEYCNCTLAKVLGLSEGSITHHVKKLEEAGLIVGRNKGHFTIYYTAEDLNEML